MLRKEFAGSVLGVPGRFHNVVAWPAPLATIANQKWVSERREYEEGGQKLALRVEVRFDDECKNGHETFAITATGYRWGGGRWVEDSGGCLHDEIEKVFPELAPLIKWHLCSSDWPMHYVANTVYHAGDRDHHGLRKGEVRQIRNGKTGQLAWVLEGATDLPKYVDSDTCPPATTALRYVPWNRVGEGKERQLDYARSSAIWPEATDEELTADNLKELLEARLPALMADFRKMVDEVGFLYSTTDKASEALCLSE